jgi:hypothetical protein
MNAAVLVGKGEVAPLKGMESLVQEHDQCVEDLESGSQSD